MMSVRLFLALCAAFVCTPMPAQKKISIPLRYEGYSAPTFKSHTRKAEFATADDGTRLAITHYTPADETTQTQFPTILWYLPGHRENIDPATGKITSAYSPAEISFFTSHGYVLAAAEMRGSGASFGTREIDRGPQIGRDGKDIVDWIAKQPWSNGKVGMVGVSYQGFAQYATAAEKPAALKAIFPEIAGLDDYTSMFFPGGTQNISLTSFASNNIQKDDQNRYVPGSRSSLPSVPVIDEDGDGDLVDEIPIDKSGDGDFLNDGQPTYRDANKRQDIYYNATRAHLSNGNLTADTLAKAPFRDSKIGASAVTFADIDPAGRPARIAVSGIAVYNRGGWFDYHARDTVMWQAILAGNTPTRLMMGPTSHSGFPDESGRFGGGPYFQFLGEKNTTAGGLMQEKLRFFDRYLKGVDNGIDREPPVMIYVMGKGWRAENEWPLKRQKIPRFYFGSEGTLSQTAPKAGFAEYAVDPTADSRYAGANRWNYMLTGAHDIMRFTESDKKRLTYTTAPLSQDTEVTGHPIITIMLKATIPDADVFAYLEDVAPDGTSIYLTEGNLRASFQALRDPQTMIGAPANVLRVRPDLPWHGYEQAHQTPEPLANGKEVTLTFDLNPTSWVFKAGHCIRVSIAGADAPSFALNPALAAADKKATYSIREGVSGSFIELPIIPAR